MAESLELQVQYSQQLIKSLDSIIDNADTIDQGFQQQLRISQSLNESLIRFSNRYENMSNSFADAANKMQKAFGNNIIPEQARLEKDLEKSSKKAKENAEGAKSVSQQLADDTNKRTDLNKSQTEMAKQRDKSTKQYSYNSKLWLVTDAIFGYVGKKSKEISDGFMNLDIVKRAISSGGWSLVIDIPKMIVMGLFKVIGSVIGLVSNFFKMSISLPFMVAAKAVEIGNAFRQDIIETIGNAHQATREYSDANSMIGKGIAKMHNIAVGSLKTFENPRSLMVKMFGEGAAGAAAFLSEISKAIDDMGTVAETIGPQVTNGSKSAEYLLVAMRTLGINSKDLSYYALDTSVRVGNIATTLDNVRAATEQAANMFDVDTKQVLQGFHKLRTNIKDFGHLSDQNLANTVARMRQLNVGAEDLVNIFNKFTSFDEAAKTSAMLYQSFGMSIDSLDLLTARDPGEIVEKFRDAMFATGRDYQDLNRHEKQLMQTTTGMSDAMLKSLMTYQNMGLTYSEAKQKIANDNPTKKQIKAIKSLTSSIKQIQKVMTFKSPFEAFLKGLMKNSASSKKVVKVAKSLSSMYESIYLFGLNLDKSAILAITKPIIMIVQKVDTIFKSQQFKDSIFQATKIVSSVIGFVSPQKFKSENRKKVDNILNVLKTTETAQLDSDYVKRAKLREKTKLALKIMTTNKETNKLLKERNLLDTKNNKNLSLDVALKHIREIASEVKSKKGKDAMNNIIDDLQTNTFNIFGDIIASNEYKDNSGIAGQVKRTSEDMKNLFRQGGGLFSDIFYLGGKIMGSIIKGAAITVSVFFNLLTSTLDSTDNPNSPLMKSLRQLGFDINKDFSILDWLGISKKEHEDLVKELSSAWTGFTWESHRIFAAGSFVVKELASMFTSLAYSMIGAFASMLVVGIESLPWWKREPLEALLGNKMQNLRDAATIKTFDKGNVSNVTLAITTAKKQSKSSAASGLFGSGIGAEFILGEKAAQEKFDQIKSSLKKDLGDDLFKKGNPYYDQFTETEDNFNKIKATNYMLDQDEKKYHMAILMTDAMRKHKILSEIIPPGDLKNTVEGIDEKTYDNKNKRDIYKGLSSSKVINNLYATINKSFKAKYIPKNYVEEQMGYARGIGTLGMFSEDAANKNYIRALNAIKDNYNNSPSITSKTYLENLQTNLDKRTDKVQDGGLSSILANDGLKLFTEDGKVIVPHTMDELINLSGDDKASLVSVFANIGSTYAQVSKAITTINEIKKEKKKKASIKKLVDKALQVIEVYNEKIENSKVEFV